MGVVVAGQGANQNTLARGAQMGMVHARDDTPRGRFNRLGAGTTIGSPHITPALVVAIAFSPDTVGSNPGRLD